MNVLETVARLALIDFTTRLQLYIEEHRELPDLSGEFGDEYVNGILDIISHLDEEPLANKYEAFIIGSVDVGELENQTTHDRIRIHIIDFLHDWFDQYAEGFKDNILNGVSHPRTYGAFIT